jgi:UDP-N-acetylmuramoylalanine--D-glutamate ligase
VLIGEAADEMADVFTKPSVARASSMDEAVAIARGIAVSGDVVLLSPGCASFDMFTSAEARGDAFARAATGIAGVRG